jgi:colanic acid biosynthesis protein WcaH
VTAADPREPTGDLEAAIRQIEAAAGDPRGGRGVPLPVFLMISRLVPLFTVDLLVQDAEGRTLLTWRDDAYFGAGWHVPGGAVRYKETIAQRIQACAAEELGAEVAFDPVPLAVEEEIDPAQRTRGHNVALLYRCRLLAGPDPARRAAPGRPRPDEWAWHERSPDDLLPVHRRYARFLGAPPR